MAGPTFPELVRAILVTLATAWRPCQPLLASAALVALAISAVAGFGFPGEAGEAVAAVPMLALTLAVSAGVAGSIVAGDPVYTRFGEVIRAPRAYVFIVRYLLLSLGLSLPLIAILPAVLVPGGAQIGAGTALVLLATLLVVLWLGARLSVFPYAAFLARPLSVAESFRATEGHALKIIGCILLFASATLLVVTLATFLLSGLLAGLGAGSAASLAIQSLGQIAGAYAIDCVYGTITRLLVAAPPAPGEPAA